MRRIRHLFLVAASFGLLASGVWHSAGAAAVRNPHIVHLIFYLSNVDGGKEVDAITNSLKKVKSTDQISVDPERRWLLVQFDSHAVSYHQVAKGIIDAGAEAGKNYDPRLKIQVPDYAAGTNAASVDAIFAGKRLNQRVHIEPVDKSAGMFLVHFLPLKLDPAETGPQGFNGGHLNHPVSDPPPRGLGLKFIYASKDEPAER